MRTEVVELAHQAGVDPDELLEWWSERAAIREIDGNQSREDAERDALDDMRELIELGPWMLRKGPRSATPALDAKRARETR